MANADSRNPQGTGRVGEKEVIQLVPCPNCGKRLTPLPRNYPMYDVQCEACSFRAQVKTNRCKPKNEIFGAGWEILNKVLRAGFMIPPLIVNFKWDGKQDIRFYPFIPKGNIKKTAVKGPYAMFNYIGLGELPCMTLFEGPKKRQVRPRRAIRRSSSRRSKKMTGLAAAAKALAKAGVPMHTKEIVRVAIEKGYWHPGGKTPAATIYTAISNEIATKGSDSRFRKTGPGTFGLAK